MYLDEHMAFPEVITGDEKTFNLTRRTNMKQYANDQMILHHSFSIPEYVICLILTKNIQYKFILNFHYIPFDFDIAG